MAAGEITVPKPEVFPESAVTWRYLRELARKTIRPRREFRRGRALRLQARSRLPSPRRLAPPSSGMPRALRGTAKRDDRAKRTQREPIATRLRRGPCAAFLSPYSFVPTPQRRTGEERRHFRACLPLAASQRLSALLRRIVYATQATLLIFRLRRRYKVHSCACDCKPVANVALAKQCLKSWAA